LHFCRQISQRLAGSVLTLATCPFVICVAPARLHLRTLSPGGGAANLETPPISRMVSARLRKSSQPFVSSVKLEQIFIRAVARADVATKAVVSDADLCGFAVVVFPM